ncbi:MAG: hypothetical protein RQ756_06780 [Flavobacteriaceae bacterium]|nr:hypothetical protein [Flavobacteriaceae bacterium]
MIRLLLFSLTFIFVYGCQSDKSQAITKDYVPLSGKISNPKADYVVVYREDHQFHDSINLNAQNIFQTKISNEYLPSLFYFRSGSETQMFFIEPGDSLTLHLNSLEFDESLQFSGIGAEKNNFLVNMFLKHEDEELLQFKGENSFFRLESAEFKQKVDSLKEVKLSELEAFAKTENISEQYRSLAYQNILCNVFARIEKYPFYKYGVKNWSSDANLPKDFYEHRSQVDFNNGKNYITYSFNRYLYSLINNLAHQKIAAGTPPELDYEAHLQLAKLEVIDSALTNKLIKNRISYRTTRNYLSKCKEPDHIKRVVDRFKQINTDSNNLTNIAEMTTSYLALAPGNTLPSLSINDAVNNTYQINDISNKPQLLFFWTPDQPQHQKSIHQIAERLSKQFSNIDFISINLNEEFPEGNYMLNDDKDNFHQFKAQCHKELIHKLAITHYNRAILVNESKQILDPNLNLFIPNIDRVISSHFE